MELSPVRHKPVAHLPATLTQDSLGQYHEIHEQGGSESLSDHDYDHDHDHNNNDNHKPHQAVTRAQESETRLKNRKGRVCGWWQSIGGLLGALTLIAGTFLIVVACAILIFLWRSADAARDRQEPAFWRHIVHREWTPKVVTICSAVIRTAITFQIGLLVAALAAVVLETTGVYLGDVPVLSTARAVKPSPMDVLPAILRRSVGTGVSGMVHAAIAVLALSITLVSIFTSTILVSDLEISLIAAKAVTNDIRVGFESYGVADYGKNGVGLWTSRPPAQWRFSEVKVQGRKLGDTGGTYRAMLPFQEDARRAALEFYKGPAAVSNMRTICTALPLDRFKVAKPWKRASEHSYDEDPPELILVAHNVEAEELQSGEAWTCRVDPVDDETGTSRRDGTKNALDGEKFEWPLTLCHSGGVTRAMDELPTEDAGIEDEYNFQHFIVINATMFPEGAKGSNGSWTDAEGSWDAGRPMDNFTSTSDDLWSMIFDAEGKEMMRGSLCYFNQHNSRLVNVTMRGGPISAEPRWRHYDKNLDVLRQFGVDAEMDIYSPQDDDFERRGILELEIGSIPDDPYYNTFGKWMNNGIGGEGKGAPDGGWNMKAAPAAATERSMNPAHSGVFQTILMETSDPALAVQSLMMRLYQMKFYDWLDSFDDNHPITTISAMEMLVPVRWTGLIIVLTFVVVHLVVVFLMTGLFLRRTHGSALGNSWQVVAQTSGVIQESDQDVRDTQGIPLKRALDNEVDVWAKRNGRSKDVYEVAFDDQGERLRLRLRESISGFPPSKGQFAETQM